MKKYKFYKKRKSKHLNVISITVIFISLLFVFSIGYSSWNTKFTIDSTVNLKNNCRTIYFEKPTSWTGNNIYCWMWGYNNNNIVNNANSYPGIEMKKVDGTSNIYSYTVPENDTNYEIYSMISFCTEELTKVSPSDQLSIRKHVTVDINFSKSNWGDLFKVAPYNDPNNPNNTRVYIISSFQGTSEGVDRYAYSWKTTSDYRTAWPGIKMERCANNIYSYIVDRDRYLYLIFSLGSQQTKDLNVPTKQDRTFLGYGII